MPNIYFSFAGRSLFKAFKMIMYKLCVHCRELLKVVQFSNFNTHVKFCQLYGKNILNYDPEHFSCKICSKLFPKYEESGEISLTAIQHVMNCNAKDDQNQNKGQGGTVIQILNFCS